MQYIFSILHGLGTMALITICYGAVQRLQLARWRRHLFVGTFFGMGASFAMLDSTAMNAATLIDPRDLFIVFAGAFLGPLGSAAAFGVAASVRLALAGPGMGWDLLGIALAALLGLMWSMPWLRPRRMRLHHFAEIGVTTSLTLVLLFVVPLSSPPATLARIACYILLFNVVAATMFGFLLERERELARRERSLSDSADRDFLTQCLNRRGFTRTYERAKASLGQDSMAMIVIDLDRFKTINDTFGHQVGDEVLALAASALRGALRPIDSIARIGGEEFAVLLPEVGEAEARDIAERLRQAVKEGVSLPALPDLRVTASVGGSVSLRKWPPLEIALKIADDGLYSAKESGRDRTVMMPLLAA